MTSPAGQYDPVAIDGGAGDDSLFANRAGSTVKDVVVWGVGDIGLDTLFDFSLLYDDLPCEPGSPAAGPEADNLLGFDDGGDALLAANVAGHARDGIARFEAVDAVALGAAIRDGSVFSTQTAGLDDDAPGGFAPAKDAVGVGLSLGILFRSAAGRAQDAPDRDTGETAGTRRRLAAAALLLAVPLSPAGRS